jgi:hypothetical protein
MTWGDQKRYQDIAIINVGKSSPTEPKKRNRNPFLQFLMAFLAAILLLVISYFAAVKTGLIAPAHNHCCFGVLVLEFDFDAPD